MISECVYYLKLHFIINCVDSVLTHKRNYSFYRINQGGAEEAFLFQVNVAHNLNTYSVQHAITDDVV